MRYLILSTLLFSSSVLAMGHTGSGMDHSDHMDHSGHMDHEMMPKVMPEPMPMVVPVQAPMLMPVMEMEADEEIEVHTSHSPALIEMPPTPLMQMMEDATTWHGMEAHHSDIPSTEAYQHINHTMHEAMMIDYSGNADIDFLRGMIPHHQGAIDMARVQNLYGKDGNVKVFGNKIIRDQIREIRWMETLLQTLEFEHTLQPRFSAASIEANQQVNHAMHKNMALKFTDNADIDFMRGMIPHHQGAVAMSEVVLKYGHDKRVKDLARGIINAQTSEIILMNKWLSRLKWRAPLWRL